MKKSGCRVSDDTGRLIIKCLLMTKLAIFLVFALSIQSFANGYGQGNISLRLEKTQLKKVFKAIEAEGFFRFVYKDEILPKDKLISIRTEHALLEDVLSRILDNTGLSYHKLSDNLVVITKETGADNTVMLLAVKIGGKVTNDKGEPLKGVSVVEKGTNNGTVTGDDGSYSLQVTSPNAILVFSYIGYNNQEFAVKGKNVADIQLVTTDNSLKDIVVVGYATQKKVTVTGAVATVKGAELQKSPTVNLSNSLAGRLPGIIAIQASGEPGYDGSTIQIRGTNTIGNSGAMVVIDGIPDRAGGLERLNPADIENVSVLKDASAAIYGVRGANGVILITTKRGKSGVPQLSYDLNEGWAQPTRIPKLMNGPEYAEVNNELYLFNHVPASEWTAGWSALKQSGTYTTTNGDVVNAPYSPDYIQKTKDGSDPWGHPNTDWFKGALKNWSNQVRHNLQINGGSENVHYLASLGYLDQDGYYKHSATGYKQYDMRLNMDAKVNKYINTSIGLTAREEFRFYPTQSAGSIFRMLMRGKPTEPEIWPNGLPGPDIENGQNPVVITTNQTGYDKQWKDYFQTNGKVEITNPWVSGLKLTLSGALDKLITRGKKWETPWYLYFWDHTSYEADGKTPLLTKSVRSTFTDPRLSQNDENQLNVNLTGLLSYDRTFGDHTINLLAGVSKETVADDGFNAFRRYFISSAVDQLFAGGSDQQNTGGAGYNRARMSYFGRVGYNYKEKYIVEFLWRTDGSYIFPKEKRFGFFPGVLAGWNISNEDWFNKNVSFVNYLKLRGSYGQLGNDQVYYNGALQEYAFSSLYNLGTQVINDAVLKTLTETVVPNDQFTWEVARNSDIGLEGTMLNSKISFELDYFYNRRNNMLIHPGSVPGSTGISGLLPPVNKGKLQNKGFEFRIGYNGQSGGFKYGISVNGGFAKNKILYWDEASGAPTYQLATGHSYGSNGPNFLAYEFDGVFKDQKDIDSRTLDYTSLAGTLRPGDMKFKDVNHDGKITGDDQVRLDKNRDPTFTGGVMLNASYSGFDLSILFQAATGGLLFFGTESGDIGNYLQYSYDHRWSVEHPSSTDPRLANRGDTYYTGGGAGNNTYFLRNSNYIRLKNIELGYTLGSFVKKAGVSNFRFYVSGLNLLTWDKMKIWDPESTSGNGQYYPQSRILNTGLRVTF